MRRGCSVAGCDATVQAKGLCHRCYTREWARARHRQGSANEDYPGKGLRWQPGEFERLIERTPPSGWKLLFWQDVSIAAKRSYGSVVRHANRFGYKAKVDKSLRGATGWRKED